MKILTFFSLLITWELTLAFNQVSHAYGRLLRTYSTSPAKLDVELGDRTYPIYVGQGLLDEGTEIKRHVKASKALIITNTLIGPLYLAKVRKQLESAGVQVYDVILPDGEEYKTMEVLMMIIDKAMQCKLDRKSVFVALGGGVIGDTAGFAAAIYQRGVKFIQIPTTLMAMVDSAVGGKTAVNHPLGKNMIGAFYQPDCVIADLSTLDTLKAREFRSGISEIIKYGLIRDKEFFYWLEKNMELLLNRDDKVLTEAVIRSCQNKADVVAADEKEDNIRATLNLGHTFGHAIETGMGYGTWLHGEAVATGTVMACELSYKQGFISQETFERIKKLISQSTLPTTLQNDEAIQEIGLSSFTDRLSKLTKEEFLDLMSMDKKVANGKLSLVLLHDVGNAVITNSFNNELLDSVVSAYCNR